MANQPTKLQSIRFISDGTVAAAACFTASSPWFSGHFPGNPILPAVAILAVVWEAAQALAAQSGEHFLIRQIKRVRFRRIVKPDERLDLTVSFRREERLLEFEVAVDSEFAAAGAALVECETLSDFALPAPANSFLLGGATSGNVYALAETIPEQARMLGEGANLACVLSPDKAVIAAAVVAALTSRIDLLLPPVLSERVIGELQADAAIKMAITDRPVEAAKHWRVVQLAPTTETRPAPPLRRDPDAPFLFLQTGGSTGAPARWSKTPHNLLRETKLLIDKYGIGPQDVILSTVPPQHIYGLLFTVLLPFLSRARVVNEVCCFPREIADALATHGATVLVAAPPHYHALRHTALAAPHLRRAFSSGGMLDAADAERFHEQTGVGVVEVYGSTETGGVATRCRAAGEQTWRAHAILQWRIEDERLCVASPFTSPEAPRAADGFFRTGDRAEAGADETFVLYGRADGIVKVSGNRVDLAEVEEKIRTAPHVADAVVLSLPIDGVRENEIAALVVGEIPEEELRRHLADRLEPYAVPRVIKFVESIPVTAAGKRDRAAMIELFNR
jgi:3-hydroxymyristoyl/3-hydroxydecanoyl-(acyl carrier protein) dehydratase